MDGSFAEGTEVTVFLLVKFQNLEVVEIDRAKIWSSFGGLSADAANKFSLGLLGLHSFVLAERITLASTAPATASTFHHDRSGRASVASVGYPFSSQT